MICTLVVLVRYKFFNQQLSNQSKNKELPMKKKNIILAIMDTAFVLMANHISTAIAAVSR